MLIKFQRDTLLKPLAQTTGFVEKNALEHKSPG